MRPTFLKKIVKILNIFAKKSNVTFLDVSLVTNLLLVSSVHLANAASIMEILIATASWSSNTNLTAKQCEAIFGAIQGESKLNKLVL